MRTVTTLLPLLPEVPCLGCYLWSNGQWVFVLHPPFSSGVALEQSRVRGPITGSIASETVHQQ